MSSNFLGVIVSKVLIFSCVYGKLNTQMATNNKRTIYIFIFLLALLFPLTTYAQTKIKVLTLKGDIINPVTADYIERGLKSAQEENALLILIIDTPGGLLKSTEKIVKFILNSPVPVITYIYPPGARAASAGTFISYASHIIAMSPSTHIGAAHPIVGGGRWGTLDEDTKDKIINDTIAWAKNIAQTRNRPFSFIKSAIERSISLTEKEALEKKVCNVIAKSLNELIEKIDGETITTSSAKIKISTKEFSIEEINLTKREKILNTLIEPNIAYLLLILGFLGLIFEVTHPGFGFPGVAGIICLILSFYAFSILPVNYAGLTLIILGIIFFIVEAFTPTFGLFTLGGVTSFALGSIMLFSGPKFIKVSLTMIIPLALGLGLFSLFICAKIIQGHLKKSKSGKEGLIGEKGTAYTNISKRGKVFIHGEIWNAIASEEVKKGEEIEVIDVKNLTLTVKRKEV